MTTRIPAMAISLADQLKQRDAQIARLKDSLATTEAERDDLAATLIEASSAYNLNGERDTILEAQLAIVRMSHEGARAMRERDALKDSLADESAGRLAAIQEAAETKHLLRDAKATTEGRPTIVCLCGSTRFIDAFQKAEFEETLAGRIVLTIGCDTKSDADLFSGEQGERVKEMLDRLHKQKIDLADEILVLNVGGYVGNSTKSEIVHAFHRGKRIRWLEPDSANVIMQFQSLAEVTT